VEQAAGNAIVVAVSRRSCEAEKAPMFRNILSSSKTNREQNRLNPFIFNQKHNYAVLEVNIQQRFLISLTAY